MTDRPELSGISSTTHQPAGASLVNVTCTESSVKILLACFTASYLLHTVNYPGVTLCSSAYKPSTLPCPIHVAARAICSVYKTLDSAKNLVDYY